MSMRGTRRRTVTAPAALLPGPEGMPEGGV